MKTRKRCKAQHVARPACAKATFHFILTYRLAMLLPPSETSAQRISASLQSPFMQISDQGNTITAVNIQGGCPQSYRLGCGLPLLVRTISLQHRPSTLPKNFRGELQFRNLAPKFSKISGITGLKFTIF